MAHAQAVQPRRKFKKKKSIIIAVHKKSTITTLPARRERITATWHLVASNVLTSCERDGKCENCPNLNAGVGKGRMMENGQTITQGLVKIR